MRLLLVFLCFALGMVAHASDFADAIPPNCRQVVLVTGTDWNSPRGKLQRFDREHRGAPWRQIGEVCEVMLGERGLAWGRGLHVEAQNATRLKREGDRRAPAGVFRLTSAFGRQTAAKVAITRFPYRQIRGDSEAVDDPASRFYNRIVQRTQVQSVDWKTSERMAEIADYELGVVVAHNPKNIPGAGSCIFIHQWRGERAGTAGCTVMRAAHLAELVRWLDARKVPVLVQLPRSAIPPDFP